MRKTKIPGWWLVWILLAAQAGAGRAEETPDAAIRQIMGEQAAAWNRGDVEAFMRGYKDAADTTFIGKSIEHGYAMILARYKKAYPSREAMGKLDFSELAVRPIGPDHAIVTGRFHLARAAAAGGEASGVFSLVWEKTPSGWKTILDHTTGD